MDLETLFAPLLVVVCIGAIGFILTGSNQNEKARKRVASLESRKNAKRASAAASSDASNRDRRKKVSEALSKVDEQTKQAKKKKRVSLEQQFDRAGLEFTKSQFYIGSLIAAGVLGLIGLITGQKIWVTALMLFIGGFGLPRWFVSFATKRRQKKFAQEFSNAIDIIVRGVKSGLPVNECLKIIANESPKPVCEEFQELVEGARIGMTLEQSLERMFDRMPLQEVRFFGIVLMIQQKTGGNLAEALTNLARVLRGRKLMQGKIKALSAEAKASAMIIGALPFIVMGSVKLASPDYLDPLFLTRPGNLILIGAGVWMCIGIYVMRNMTQIKV